MVIHFKLKMDLAKKNAQVVTAGFLFHAFEFQTSCVSLQRRDIEKHNLQQNFSSAILTVCYVPFLCMTLQLDTGV